VLTLSFNLSRGPPLCGTDGPRSSDEWANVATEAYGTDGPRSSDKGLTKRGSGGGGNGEWANVATEAFRDSDRGCGTGKRLQGSGGGGCTADVEFSGWGFEGEVSGTLLATC
nr:hypothetical protein [Tanacetum cinerariifolium]